MTRDCLIAFEQRVADAFAAKQIRSPIHLCSDSQADHLIEIFKDIKPDDWICCTWRNHFHCLLKGMPEDELFDAIRHGRSMFISSARQRIVCSAIVGGALPIAAGIGLGIRYRGGAERVHVFVGDMAARTGLFHEFEQYCRGHALPVTVTVEDNGVSTNANTEDTWGRSTTPLPTRRYQYERNWPHSGIHEFVAF